MVSPAVHFDELGFEVSADLGENSVQPSDGIGVEHVAAVFRHKDQVDVHGEHAVSPRRISLLRFIGQSIIPP